MDNILNIYCYVLRKHVSTCFANQQNINPIELNKERFNAKAVFIAALIYLKYNAKIENNIVLEANEWLKKSFTKDNLFSNIIDNSNGNLIKLVNTQLINVLMIETIDITVFYEIMLSIESGSDNTIGDISKAKNYRNKLGSYYTPADFAKEITKKTIDTYFELNYGIKKLSEFNRGLNALEILLQDISTITFADFSCGGGNFIIEIIDYFTAIFNNIALDSATQSALLKSIALNISAFDVDCLALEIAKLNLLLKINNFSIYNDLNKTFIHANFLLQTEFPLDVLKKVDIFSKGYIYHEQLSLNRHKLQKYDVILGNPPWEKIRFEEKKFYALYSSTIGDNHFKSSRTIEIEETKINNIELSAFSNEFKNEIEKAKSDLKNNSFFQLSNNGELNTYALFTEAALRLSSKKGVIGLVLKSAIVTSQVNQKLPIPSKKEIAEEITFNGYKTSIKQHISLLVFALLKNDNRLNCLFKNLEFDNELALNDSKFNLIRNIDLLFILLYKLNNSELVLVLHSFSKQYSKSDLMWFKKELEQLFLFNNAVSTSSSFIAASCPIG